MNKINNLPATNYRPDIDGLRAIAIISVICFHAFPNWLKGGFVGVNIFFVISGYLISTIIFSNLSNEEINFHAHWDAGFYGLSKLGNTLYNL